MNLRVSALLGLGLTAGSLLQSAYAGEMYLSLYYGTAPIKGADVFVNGTSVGKTSDAGALEYEVDEGKYDVVIGTSEPLIASFSFESDDDDQNVDVKVDTSSAEPTIDFDKYFPEDKTGPSGKITGYIKDIFNQPIYNAQVAVDELGIYTNTDTSGYFELDAVRGNRYLTVTGANSAPSDAFVRVVAGSVVDLDIKLRPKIASGAVEVEETIVIAKAFNANPVDSVSVEFESMTVTDALDFIQIQRYGDSNVASAVRRVAGVTVRDGKYAMVRGLDGRYLANSINNNPMPSTDPLRRDVQLDMFPANILGGLEVQKGFTADQPASSTAGSLKIKTREPLEERETKFSFSVTHRDGVTGEDVLDYEGSESDAWGSDDGFRALPNQAKDLIDGQLTGNDLTLTNSERASLAQEFTNVYNPRTTTADPDFSLGVSHGNAFDLDSATLSFYATTGYSRNTNVRQNAETNIGSLRFIDELGEEKHLREEDLVQSEINYSLNGYIASKAEFDAVDIEHKSLYIRQTSDVTRQIEEFEDASDQERAYTTLEWTEREFNSHQIDAKYVFLGSHELNVGVNVAESSRHQPDRRSYIYQNSIGVDRRTLVGPSVERRWSELTDESVSFSANYQGEFDVADFAYVTLNVGGSSNTIDRDVDLYRLRFRMTDQNSLADAWGVDGAFSQIDPETIFIGDNLSFVNGNGSLAIALESSTVNTDSYESEVTTDAYFINTETEIGEYVTVIAGVRKEEYSQDLAYPFAPQSTPESLEEENTLPSFAVNYKPSESWQFRLGYSETVSYPGITERAESVLFDPEDQEIIGSPDLISSTIENVDVRAEYYFNEALSSITLAYFSKEIANPIEQTFASAGVVDRLTYRNNKSAEVTGFELDANVTLFDGSIFEGFVGGNIAVTDSKIVLNDRSLSDGDIDGRDLQGLSPLLANVQFGLDYLPLGLSGTILVNYFDDRIESTRTGIVLGNAINQPIYELGRTELDVNFSWEAEFGGKLSLSFGNILDQDVKFEGRSNINGDVNYLRSYNRGSTVQLGYSQNFF